MSAAFDSPSPWQRVRRVIVGFDGPLIVAVLWLAVIGLVTM
jgi:hypothetical protein